MSVPLIEEIVSKYIELRDREAALAKKQAEDMKPINEAMANIENYLMHKMNELGCDSFKTEAGTAFKAIKTSCQMADPIAFKDFVFKPVTEGVVNYLTNSGHALRDIDYGALANIIRDMPLWDMIDFRAGKKGITGYIENEQKPVPGVNVNIISTINIRRA
jgi:hypothetical protein